MKSDNEKTWKLIGHSYSIADTGDYNGCYEITNGVVSIFTEDDGIEALEPIVQALNDSGCHFYERNPLEIEVEILKMQLDALRESTRWIPVSERMPTEEDADENGEVLAYAPKAFLPTQVLKWNMITKYKRPTTHWQRINPPEDKP